MKTVTIKDLFENAVHYGHKKSYWNPKMKQYIFAEKNGVHLIDLNKTAESLEEACKFLHSASAGGKKVLMVGTKPQVSDMIKEMAKHLKLPFVSKKWPGGLLTNWSVFKERITHLKQLREDLDSGDLAAKFTKKEVAKMEKELEKLENSLGGVEDMNGLPDVLFVVDPHNETLAIKEANTKKIPVVAIVDTNADPDGVDYVIPANDDSRKSLALVLETIAAACSAKPKKQEVKKVA